MFLLTETNDTSDSVSSTVTDGFYQPIKDYVKMNTVNSKQYAFATIFMRDGSKTSFKPKYPNFANRKHTHSEEFVIEELEDFISRNGPMVETVYIYSYNSPCLQRKGGVQPCMFMLMQKAAEWKEKYNILLKVGFTKFWVPKCPDWFEELISTLDSEKFKDYRFKLDYKNLADKFKKSPIFSLLSQVDNLEKNTLFDKITSTRKDLLDLAQSLDNIGLRDDLLLKGEQLINSCKCSPIVRDEFCRILLKEWSETVNNSFEKDIKSKIRKEVGHAVILLFMDKLRSDWRNSFPLKLYRVSSPLQPNDNDVQ
ncbi:uncharacterized protein LOC121642816 [Melanotaenia boesemani]|uniref:uncharacterized protein LOC121642816 n=1 Tax=Melanotaenia boesemani TaxID=1250792 RepID=UPI001C0460B2|nr:uncharacterized protein LOC121642816 [Melanotaenia boesemani]XP_041845713.1 uncharacterized protein LOC121642816 [Melanotaenia boesemani]